MAHNFFEKLTATIECNQSLLAVGLDPNPEMIPPSYDSQTQLQQFEQWLNFIVEETVDRVCAYKPTLGFYQALGAPGLELLDRILAKIPDTIPIILDAKHGDLNTSSAIARLAFNQWRVDAITLNPYAGQDEVAPFLMYPDKAAFVLCRTSNPAEALQDYPSPESPFYLQVVKEVRNWGTPEQLGLEVGTTSAKILAKVRAIAPERLILVRSIWGAGDEIDRAIESGLDRNGSGLLVPVPQDLLASPNLATRVCDINQTINQTRDRVREENASCELWMPNVCTLKPHPHQDLILQLFDLGCILFGEYVQASGETFSYYIDLRKVISNPQVFHKMLNAYAEILQELTFDRIAGIPYGSLPTATGLALRLNHPMIFPRKEVKAHGTRRLVEGNFHPGDKVVVVDDILISGKSAIEGADKLRSVGLHVEDIVVFIDHGRGVKERLQAQGYRAHCVLNLDDITDTLARTGRITAEQAATF
jgi:uridine monophosphate synthetase